LENELPRRHKIEKLDKIIPDAYHGTDFESAQEIVETSKFLPSKGEDSYLGNGVYFFEGSELEAKNWAIGKNKLNYAVLQATVFLGKCLNLNIIEHRRLVTSMFNYLLKTRGMPKINDALVINILAQISPIDTVRATYCQPGQGKLFNFSRFFNYISPMVCVRNTNNIKEIKFAEYGAVRK